MIVMRVFSVERTGKFLLLASPQKKKVLADSLLWEMMAVIASDVMLRLS